MNISLLKLVRILNNKEKHGPYDRDDLNYIGITDTEILLGEVSKKDYYKTIFIKSFLMVITNIMKAEGIKKKDYQ